VRFLIDENLSPRICPLLAAAGHHAVHVRDLAADRGDFGRELAATRATEPSVMLLRQLPDVVRAADIASLLLANLTEEVAAALRAGAFVVLTPQAVRVRYLPIR
jgi:predicted nuclease of predicted toxin-antitoxin system